MSITPNTVELDTSGETKRASPTAGRGDRGIFLCHAVWIPQALFLLYLILKNTVDIPSTDDFDAELPFLQQIVEGRVTFDDLIAQTSEYRPAVPRLVAWLSMVLTGWNLRLTAVVTWALACFCATFVCLLGRFSFKDNLRLRLFQCFIAGSLILGTVQYEIWLNVSSLCWLFTEVSVLGGVYIANSGLALRSKFIFGILLSIIATYSAATGMIAWILLPLAIVIPLPPLDLRRSASWFGAWLAIGALCVGRFFWDFHHNPEAPKSIHFENPVLFLKFLLATVGSPFAYGTAIPPETQALVFGFVSVCLFGGISVYVWRHRKDTLLVRRAGPWFVLTFFSFANAGGTAVGRSGFGIENAFAPRHANLNIYGAIALVFLVPLVIEHFLALRKRNACSDIQSFSGDVTEMVATARLPEPGLYEKRAASFLAVFATLTVAVHIFGSVFVLERYEATRITWHATKTAVLLSRFFQDDELLRPMLSTRTFAECEPRIEFLDSYGLLRPSRLQSDNVLRYLGDPSGGVGHCGAIEQAGEVGRNIVGLSGWAVFPERKTLADSVVLTWQQGSDYAKIFAIARMGLIREDLVKKLGNAGYRRAGWVARFDAGALPKGQIVIRAWAFDPNAAKVFELSGSFNLNRQ